MHTSLMLVYITICRKYVNGDKHKQIINLLNIIFYSFCIVRLFYQSNSDDLTSSQYLINGWSDNVHLMVELKI